MEKADGSPAHPPGMEFTLTRKPVKTREKSRRKFMAKEACPAVLLATAAQEAPGQERRGGQALLSAQGKSAKGASRKHRRKPAPPCRLPCPSA